LEKGGVFYSYCIYHVLQVQNISLWKASVFYSSRLMVYLQDTWFLCCTTPSNIIQYQLGLILSCVVRCCMLVEGVVWHKNHLLCKLWEMAAVLRQLLFSLTKRLQNTQIAGAILTSFKKGIKFIYMWDAVSLRHVVPKTFIINIRKWVRMT
jgi:hypothetical protein